MLTDLSQQVAKSFEEMELRQSLLESSIQETSTNPPGTSTLENAMRSRRTLQQKERGERLLKAIAEARKSAEAEQVEILVKAEKDAVEGETLSKKSVAAERKLQAERIAAKEKEQIAEETRLKLSSQQAKINGLRNEVTRANVAIQESKLERELEQAMPQVRALLSGFISKGTKFREEGTEGPVSLSYIRSQGALDFKEDSLQYLRIIANGGDRPKGGLAFGGLTANENSFEARKLLIKFGDLMVKKGMLAP
jgi:hypothetical protein